MSVEVRDEDRQALNLHDNPDAQAWAKEFCKMYSVYAEDGVVQDKEGLMIAWFANAMMAMHDTCHRAQSPPASAEDLVKIILARRFADVLNRMSLSTNDTKLAVQLLNDEMPNFTWIVTENGDARVFNKEVE